MQRIFFCSTHLLQGLAQKQQLLFLFGFLVASVFVSGCIQMFTSASRRFVFTVSSLSVIHCRPSRPFICSLLLLLPSLAIQSFTSPSCRRCRLLSRFAVPLSASHSFTSASSRHRWPTTRSSNSQCRLVVVLRVPQESYKSGYWPARYVTNSCCALHKSVTCISEKLPLNIRT